MAGCRTRQELLAATDLSREAYASNTVFGRDVEREAEMITEGGFKASLAQVIAKNYPDALRKILADGKEAGFSVDIPLEMKTGKRVYFKTALHDAAQQARTELCGILLDHGADINARDAGGVTPLQWAAYWLESRAGIVQTMQFLLDRGACASTADNQGETVLHGVFSSYAKLRWRRDGGLGKGLASKEDELYLTRLLVKHGANPDFVPDGASARYRTPFQAAVKDGLVEQVRLLIDEFGVDWTQRTLSKKAMYQIASPEVKALLFSYKTTQEVATSLADEEMRPAAPKKANGMSPL